MYQHILVAVGPSFSEAALSTAIERARDCNARLTLLHVIVSSPWWSGWQADSLCDTPAIVNRFALTIRRNCEKMLQCAGMRAEWRTRTLPGSGRSIGRVIAKEAERLDADLVVLGASKSVFFNVGLTHVRNVVCRNTDREVLIASERGVVNAHVIEMRDAPSHSYHA
ncbi:universal stress protein [Caballeronia insecticola]|uniref:UspA domain protein n=1 Tax=Caballeronia insecticola TaxID=758793 RepID=R4X4X8_9BURK|nr:universal stress protein [Caballeronia insecticola]BAN27697.1 UspA domain protein [Caballeronia insecticola]